MNQILCQRHRLKPVLTFSQHLRKMEDDEGNAIEHNFRAPQDLNGRTIYNMGPSKGPFIDIS